MTKMQIIAKSILTVLGLYALLTLCRLAALSYIGPEGESSVWKNVAFFLGFAPWAGFVLVLMIFENDGIALTMAGTGPAEDQQTQTAWLIKSLRVGLVLTGLMLLRKSVPEMLSLALTFRSGAFHDISGASSWTKFEYAYNLVKAVLALYLLFGAPHFVRWQVKHSLRRFGKTEELEIPGSSNPEVNEDFQ
ncbi:MAG: hypothetical protein JSW59_03290 [Phycisphaerales bacterium]|nr:MAG: hypothetical protein JSW59_03290 [Phycisphaerales bacterium]